MKIPYTLRIRGRTERMKELPRQQSRLLKEDLIILVVNLAKSPALAEASLNGEEKKTKSPEKDKRKSHFHFIMAEGGRCVEFFYFFCVL